MSSGSDQSGALARVYAAAIYELAEASGDTEVLRHELDDVAALLERDANLSSFVGNPTVKAQLRTDLIEKVFRGKLSDLGVDALHVINRKDRMTIVGEIADAYSKIDDEKNGRIEARVTTAIPLSETLRDDLSGVLSKRMGKEVRVSARVDETIGGGMVVQIDDSKYDMSVRHRLTGFKSNIAARLAREVQTGRSFVQGTAAE